MAEEQEDENKRIRPLERARGQKLKRFSERERMLKWKIFRKKTSAESKSDPCAHLLVDIEGLSDIAVSIMEF